MQLLSIALPDVLHAIASTGLVLQSQGHGQSGNRCNHPGAPPSTALQVASQVKALPRLLAM
jgi:hypothetical protein